MKRPLLGLLGLALAGCTALTPTLSEIPSASPSPLVVTHTVLVTVIPTRQPTLIPTQTLAPSITPPVLFVTTTPTTTATALEGEATAPLPANPDGGIFMDLTRSGDSLYLHCQPDVLSFGLSTSDASVVGVDFWYRLQDRLSASISTWQYGGAMEPNYAGGFTISFPASRVDPDLRSHKAWLDYQFVGVNNVGDVVGRSAKIVQQVTYTIDCTD